MKKIIILLSSCIVILLLGCGQKNVIQAERETLQSVKDSFVLHPKIIDVIKEFQSDIHTDGIYAVYFTDKNDGFAMLKQDTIVYVSFLRNTPLVKNINYKGLLTIDSLFVAIFDNNSSGINFYDTTKLFHIPLNRLKKIPECELNAVVALGVERDSLIRWIAP